MKKIYKYGLNLDYRGMGWRLPIPKDSIVRHVGEQNSQIYLWIEIDDDYLLPKVDNGCLPNEDVRIFYIFGTGEYLPFHLNFIGTVQMKNNLVWHVYEETR